MLRHISPQENWQGSVCVSVCVCDAFIMILIIFSDLLSGIAQWVIIGAVMGYFLHLPKQMTCRM